MERTTSLRGIVFEDEEEEDEEMEGIPRVTSLDSLNVSKSPQHFLSPSVSSNSLATSLDNLTIPVNTEGYNAEEEKKEKRNSNSSVPEDCEWWIRYLGYDEEKKCFKKGVLLMLKLHLYSLLCLLVCGTYIAIYVPLVISKELEFKVSNSEYKDVPDSTRIALGLGYGFHNAYIGLYGIILMVLVVGYSKLKFMIPFNIFMFCGLVGFIFSYYYVESYYKAIHSYYAILVYIILGIQILVTAGAFGYRLGQIKTVISFTASVTIVTLVFVGIIDYVGVPIFMDASNFGKSVFRISVVPCILVIKVLAIRMVCRISNFSTVYMSTDGGTLSFTIALIPVFVRAFYGRIFYLNVPTLGNLVWNAILVELFDILFKLIHWNRRYALSIFRPIVRKYYFLKPLIDKPSGDAFYGLCLCFEKTVDILAIGYATLIQILYQYKWEVSPDYATTIYSMLIQYVIEFISQLISIRLEYGFGIPVLTITKKIKFWTIYAILVSTSMMIAAVCTWRGVFILHGLYWIR